MAQVSKAARSHRKHNDDRELYQGKRRLLGTIDVTFDDKQGHSTHFDDCGCKSAAYEKEIAKLRSLLELADAVMEDYDNNLKDTDCPPCGNMRR